MSKCTTCVYNKGDDGNEYISLCDKCVKAATRLPNKDFCQEQLMLESKIGLALSFLEDVKDLVVKDIPKETVLAYIGQVEKVLKYSEERCSKYMPF